MARLSPTHCSSGPDIEDAPQSSEYAYEDQDKACHLDKFVKGRCFIPAGSGEQQQSDRCDAQALDDQQSFSLIEWLRGNGSGLWFLRQRLLAREAWGSFRVGRRKLTPMTAEKNQRWACSARFLIVSDQDFTSPAALSASRPFPPVDEASGRPGQPPLPSSQTKRKSEVSTRAASKLAISTVPSAKASTVDCPSCATVMSSKLSTPV
jgi:hypothetical protein